MTIDMRLRPPLQSWSRPPSSRKGRRTTTRYGFPRPKSVGTQTSATCWPKWTKADITLGRGDGPPIGSPHGIVPNEEISDFVRQHADRFVGFAGIDLRDIDKAVADLDGYARSDEFKGISDRAGRRLRAAVFRRPQPVPALRARQELQLPLSITLSGYLSSMAGHPTSYGTPSPVATVARKFPRLKIVVSHAAWPNVMPMLEVAFLHDNVYVSPDLYMNHVHTPGAHEYINAAKFYLADRLLFGTAYPSRPLKESVAGCQWDLDSDFAEKILHRNAARFVDWSKRNEPNHRYALPAAVAGVPRNTSISRASPGTGANRRQAGVARVRRKARWTCSSRNGPGRHRDRRGPGPQQSGR